MTHMKMPFTTCQSFTTATAKYKFNGQSDYALELGKEVYAQASSWMTAGLWKSTILASRRPRGGIRERLDGSALPVRM